MAESVRVICRCRPLNQREIALNSKICVEMDSSIGQIALRGDGPEKLFSFDGVYYMDSTAEQIYNDIIYTLVENVIEGYNGTVFAYGQTGSGKTYSMQGDEKIPAQKGIIPRTFEHIFEAISTTEHTKFLVHASYLEIYNEEVRDLLGQNRDQKLEVKEHSERGIYVAGLTMHVCHSFRDCERLMQTGFDNRHVGATLMNKDSSRSHSIFTIYVEALSEAGNIRMGKLNLVDLAGSERQAKTGAVGDRFKEATKINLSLSALGNVISALVDGKAKHIPYRDSKLTRLLQDSLGGNTKTVMIACISPSDNNYDESLSTLRYANRAKNIKNKPRINEDPKDALLREYQQEIERLKSLVQNPEKIVVPSQDEIEAEKAKLRAEFEQAMKELRFEYENEQKSKVKLEQDLNSLKQQYENANKDLDTIQKSSLPIDEKEAKKRLEILEQQLVGGEKANDEVLKQKRYKKMKEAEKKMQRLAQAIQNADHDDPLLQAYSSTQEKLDALLKKFNYEVQKVRSLESEIQDITAEFELDRLDYLETIRKQDQQLKLCQQILEKIQPAIKKDSNYYDIEKIKKSAVWNEDQSRWILQELQLNRHILPNAHNVMPAASADLNHFSDTDEMDDSRLKKRLERSMEEDFVKSYFKQINKNDLINKYKSDKYQNNSQDKISNFMKRNQRVNGLMNGVVYTDDIYTNGNNNESNGMHRVISGKKKPQRLESLNVSRNRV